MSKVSVKKIILCCVILVAVTLFSVWFFQNHILYVDDNLSATYSRSASAYSDHDQFYVKDNVLYFVKDGLIDTVTCYVKNNWVHTFSEIPVNYENFVVVDDKTMVVQSVGEIYLSVDGKLNELWQGESLGYDGEKYLYFVNDGTLYSATLTETEPQKIISFDELLGSYHDGIVYRNEEGIYQLFYAEPNTPQLLAVGEIPLDAELYAPELMVGVRPWSNDDLRDYVYTSNYALRIGSETLDIYIYETGEIKRIYEADTDGMVVMAVAASENELYVSRQYTDGVYWPKNDEEINGTYKYDFETGAWTKIDDGTYYTLVQFDENSLYGRGVDDILDPLKRIELD